MPCLARYAVYTTPGNDTAGYDGKNLFNLPSIWPEKDLK